MSGVEQEVPLTTIDLEEADEQQLLQWIAQCEDEMARRKVIEVPHRQGCPNADNHVSEMVMSLHTYTVSGRSTYMDFSSQKLATKPAGCLGCESRIQSNLRRMFRLMKGDEWTDAAFKVKQRLDARAVACGYEVEDLVPPVTPTAIDRLLASSLIEDD